MTHILGEGAYSSVYKVKRLADGEVYALKRVKLMNLNEKEKENALNEIRILASLRNPHVVLYKEAFWENKSSSLWYPNSFYSIALSWSMQMQAIFFKLSVNTRNKVLFLKSRKFGTF